MNAMDAKLTESQTTSDKEEKVRKARLRRALNFIQELKVELKKVSWTSQEELKTYTKVVIASTFFFGFGIYFADLGIKGTLDTVSLLGRLLFGS